MKNKVIRCKEDLIGEKRKCPYPGCNIEFILTNEIHTHQNNRHIYSTNLETQFMYYQFEQKHNKRLLYGR